MSGITRSDFDRDVLNLMDTGVVVVGRDGLVASTNAAASKLLSVEADELLGKTLGSWTETSKNAENEGTAPAPGSPTRRLRVRRRTIDPTGAGVTVFLIDLAEPTSSEALARLRQLEGTLRELSTISHDISNPLTALLGRSQILKATSQGDPRVEKAAHVIEESASRISELARELSRTLRDGRQQAVDSIAAVEKSASASPVGAARE